VTGCKGWVSSHEEAVGQCQRLRVCDNSQRRTTRTAVLRKIFLALHNQLRCDSRAGVLASQRRVEQVSELTRAQMPGDERCGLTQKRGRAWVSPAGSGRLAPWSSLVDERRSRHPKSPSKKAERKQGSGPSGDRIKEPAACVALTRQ